MTNLQHGSPAITLPPKAFFETWNASAPRTCTFTIPDAEHALRHAVSLATIIADVAISRTHEIQRVSPHDQQLTFLLDFLQSLSSLLAAWPTPLGIGLAPVIQIPLDLAEAYSGCRRVEGVLCHKANTSLVLVCASFCEASAYLVAEDEDGASLRRVFCLALAHLAKISLNHEPTARLVTSVLLPLAQRLTSENPALGASTDVWVSSIRLPSTKYCIQCLTKNQEGCSTFSSHSNWVNIAGTQRGDRSRQVHRHPVASAGPEASA